MLGCSEQSAALSKPSPNTTFPSEPAAAASSSLTTTPGAEDTPAASVPNDLGSASETTALASLDTTGDSAQRVNGRVVDFWEHPVPNVPIRIGEHEALTDAEGRFAVEGVAEEYDVSLAVRIVGEVAEVYAWHYVGLTRRDPTLQIYKGLSQRTSPFSLTFSGFQSDARWRGEVGFGGQHGQRSYPIGDDIETLAGWRGPSEQTSPLRLLLWRTTEEAPNTPAQYLFTNSTTVALADAKPAAATVMLPEMPEPLPDFDVGFTTTNAPNTSHLATGYVRFGHGPSIQVAQIPRLSDSTQPFSVKVPQLPDASVTVAALSGNGANQTSFVVTYATQLTAPATAALTFPTVAALESPADATANVSLATPFTWSDTGGTYVAVFEDLAVYQIVYVVTEAPMVTVPDLEALGIYYPRGGPYRWSVESHGRASSVDELCAAPYLDPFSGDFLYPIGPRAGDGRFWRTEARTFEFD